MNYAKQEKWLKNLTSIMLISTLIFCYPLTGFAHVIVAEGKPDVTLEGVLNGAEGVVVDFNGNIYISPERDGVFTPFQRVQPTFRANFKQPLDAERHHH